MLHVQGIDYVATPEAAAAMNSLDARAAQEAMTRSQAAGHSPTGAGPSYTAGPQSLQHFLLVLDWKPLLGLQTMEGAVQSHAIQIEAGLCWLSWKNAGRMHTHCSF